MGRVIATNVNLTCSLPEQRVISLSNSNITGLSFIVKDGRSLFNAVAAFNYLTTNVTAIFVVTDLTITPDNWPTPIILTRPTTIFADPAQRLYMDCEFLWDLMQQLRCFAACGCQDDERVCGVLHVPSAGTGQQGRMVMTNDTEGSVLTIANIDQVNMSPLHGYYAPGCGQATMVGSCDTAQQLSQRGSEHAQVVLQQLQVAELLLTERFSFGLGASCLAVCVCLLHPRPARKCVGVPRYLALLLSAMNLCLVYGSRKVPVDEATCLVTLNQ